MDDGSSDGTLELLRQYAREDSRVRYLSFSRNFGKESAMYAGLENAGGDYVVTMDADLQDPPSMLPEVVRAVREEGYDSAAARRVTRKGEPPIRSFFARLFYKLIDRISRTDIVDGARDYRLMTRRMADAVLAMGEYNRFSKGIYGWVGFRTKWLPYENAVRVAGETKWSFWKLLLYSLEGIVAFSTAPLAIASLMGILFCAAAFVWLLVIVVKTLIWGDPVAGFPTLACIQLLIGGSVQLCLGIIGQYLAKTYLETQKRPIYIVSETETAVCFLSAACCVVIHLVTEKREFDLWSVIAVLPLGLSPYFLECLSYKYDSPYMALSILVSVLPFLLPDQKKDLPLYGAVSAVCCLAMCLLYQASSGVYPMLTVLLCFRRWNSVRPVKDVVRFGLVSAAGYCAGVLSFNLFFMNGLNYWGYVDPSASAGPL